jgi:hypothetical protein
VGPDKVAFTVHKKLICERSAYFSKAFNGEFKEATENNIYLPEDSPEIFPWFINWLYRDQLPQFVLEKAQGDNNSFLAYTKKAAPLFHFAQKVCLNRLPNQIIDKLQDIHHDQQVMFCHQELKTVYENTQPKSKLRTFGVLERISRTRDQGYGDENVGFDDEEDTEEGTIRCLTELGRSVPEFAEDFIELSIKYTRQFQTYGPRSILQLRDPNIGFGWCFFHTHLKDEVCHLGAEPEND